MNIKYMPEIGTLYIYTYPEIPKVLIPSVYDDRVGVFMDKKTKSKICGYEIEAGLSQIEKISVKLDLGLKEKIAICLYVLRHMAGISQEDMGRLINVSLSTYKNLEKAEQNLTFDTFEIISEKFPSIKRVIGESLLAS